MVHVHSDRASSGALPADVDTQIISLLRALVACDTRNPPREGAGIDGLFAVVRAHAPAGTTIEERDLGTGCRWIWLRRDVDGTDPSCPIVNVHIDTVPRDEGWERDPFELTEVNVDGERRVVGLGACDIKGAVAAFLVAAAHTAGPFSLLLTSDEEAGSSLCVRTFVAEHDVAGRLLLVAEPTQGYAVVAHRGIATAEVQFTGTPGHASQHRAVEDSAVSEAVRFCAAAHDVAAACDNAIRLNLGRLDGGTKANMIASSCHLRFGVRPPPERPPLAVLEELKALCRPGRATLTPGFVAPALPSVDAGADAVRAARLHSRDRARALGLPTERADHDEDLDAGIMVDFFTEAAFFSAAGADAVVFGPGDIAQAHTAGEWVRVQELVDVAAHYHRIITSMTSPSSPSSQEVR